VTIRYLSGGVATDISMSRVVASSSLAASDDSMSAAAFGLTGWKEPGHSSLMGDATMHQWDTPGLI